MGAAFSPFRMQDGPSGAEAAFVELGANLGGYGGILARQWAWSIRGGLVVGGVPCQLTDAVFN